MNITREDEKMDTTPEVRPVCRLVDYLPTKEIRPKSEHLEILTGGKSPANPITGLANNFNPTRPRYMNTFPGVKYVHTDVPTVKSSPIQQTGVTQPIHPPYTRKIYTEMCDMMEVDE